MTTFFKVFSAFALTLVALWVAYVVGANAYLNVGDGRLFVIDGAEVRVGSARTWWPGRVRGRQLQVLVHDSKVEMDLKVDEFDVNLSVIDLARKVFSTTRARIHGVSLRIRKTRLIPELCKQKEGLPPITGQAKPPGVAQGECTAQFETGMLRGAPPDPEDLLRVRLENLDVTGMREVWIEDYRSEGEIAFRGGWSFWPTQSTSVQLHDFRVREARVVRDRTTLVQRLDLDLAGAMEQVQFDHLASRTLWSAITATASVRLDAVALEALRGVVLSIDPIAPPKFPDLDGLANVHGDIDMDAGRVKTFNVDAQATQAAITLLDRRVMGSMRLQVKLDADLERSGRVRVSKGSLKLSNVQLQEGASQVQRFGDTELTLAVRGASYLDPVARKAELEFRADASRGGFFIALIPGGLPQTIADLLVSDNAPAMARGSLDATAEKASIQNLHVEADGLSLDGSFEFAPKLKGTLTAKYTTLSVEIPL